MEKPYKDAYGHDGKYYVDGPATDDECSYYGGTLYPSTRMESREDAERAAAFANIGFRQGYEKAQRDIKAALGISAKRLN